MNCAALAPGVPTPDRVEDAALRATPWVTFPRFFSASLRAAEPALGEPIRDAGDLSRIVTEAS